MSVAGDSIFDFTDIDELDPSVADGYRIIYDREVPVEVRNQTSDGNADNGTMEAIKVKMLMLGTCTHTIHSKFTYDSLTLKIKLSLVNKYRTR